MTAARRGDPASRWASTMDAARGPGRVRTAHGDTAARVAVVVAGRAEREQFQHLWLAEGATHAAGAGDRARPEDPDPLRTCFERDRDRIVHSTAFRRLAGKTQVFVFPADHQRTRLTHSTEVAQVARGVAAPLRLNLDLVEAVALGHDCAHGPGGHASEGALSQYLPGGFDHATWGADVTMARLNLCAETLDGIRNHSWSRPAPATPEGEVVSWADRIAYVCHDFEDAVSAGVVGPGDLPAEVAAFAGTSRRRQIGAFVADIVATTAETGTVGMSDRGADALAAFRRANYDRIYHRPESVAQGRAVADLLSALVEHCLAHPESVGSGIDPDADPAPQVVDWVAGMTDRYACLQAQKILGWDADRLPDGFSVR